MARRNWSREEIHQLRAWIENPHSREFTNKRIADMTGRSENAIAKAAQRFGFTRPRRRR